MMKKLLFFIGFFIFLIDFKTQAQTFVPPSDVKTNPNLYPPLEEQRQVMEWVKNPDNYKVKIYKKIEFENYTLDDKVQIEGYGHYIIYSGNYLRWSEIQSYLDKKNQIVSRSYAEYKQYLITHNLPHYFELFGN